MRHLSEVEFDNKILKEQIKTLKSIIEDLKHDLRVERETSKDYLKIHRARFEEILETYGERKNEST